MKPFLRLTLSAVILFSSSIAFAQEEATSTKADAAKGKDLSKTCVACHGADGNSTNPIWPKIAGQNASYIEKQLNDFKIDKRKDPLMKGIVAALSTQDMADLAAYFSAQGTKPGVADETKVELGRAIYKGGNLQTKVSACSACHSPTGQGNPAAKYPSVSGQHVKYLVKQLQAFKSGERANDAPSIMRDIAEKMSDAEIDAVAEYMSGLN
ncbi:MAG: cytochrome c4 [Thiotrichaceae bacterium]|nr:cytochrome c4 [Thiotrichaceae bacterium]